MNRAKCFMTRIDLSSYLALIRSNNVENVSALAFKNLALKLFAFYIYPLNSYSFSDFSNFLFSHGLEDFKRHCTDLVQ